MVVRYLGEAGLDDSDGNSDDGVYDRAELCGCVEMSDEVRNIHCYFAIEIFTLFVSKCVVVGPWFVTVQALEPLRDNSTTHRKKYNKNMN